MSNVWSEVFNSSQERSFKKGVAVFLRDDVVTDAYFVKKGRVKLVRFLMDGAELTMHRVGPGNLLAEASLFAERYHCDAICEAETTLSVLPRSDILAKLEEGGLATSALDRASHEVQSLRARVEIMRLRWLSARLDAYLAFHGPPDPGGWVRVADWIGVTAPALYRELARRREVSR